MKQTIILVDDDPDFIAAMRALLAGLPFAIASASDGNQGWKLLRRSNPILMLFDFDMPGLTGLDLLRRVRSCVVFCQTPVLLFTAHTDRSILYEGFAAGLDEFIQKPLDAREARLRIERLLSGWRPFYNTLESGQRVEGPLLALRFDSAFLAGLHEKEHFLRLAALHLAKQSLKAWLVDSMLLLELEHFDGDHIRRNFRALLRYWQKKQKQKKLFQRQGQFLEEAGQIQPSLRLFRSGLTPVSRLELEEYFSASGDSFYEFS